MKKLFLFMFIISISIILLFTFSSCENKVLKNLSELKVVENHADNIKFNNVEELEKSVDLIIVAEFLNDLTEDESIVNYTIDERIPLPEHKSISSSYSKREIKILKVLKGNEVNGNILKIIDSPAVVELNNEKYIQTFENETIPQKGMKYLLFLKKTQEGNYGIMSLEQGKFNIDGKDKKESEKEANNKQKTNLRESVINKYSSKIAEYLK